VRITPFSTHLHSLEYLVAYQPTRVVPHQVPPPIYLCIRFTFILFFIFIFCLFFLEMMDFGQNGAWEHLIFEWDVPSCIPLCSPQKGTWGNIPFGVPTSRSMSPTLWNMSPCSTSRHIFSESIRRYQVK
jgi:hypothetical protein